EWRDFRKTPRIRLQDVAMDSMFAWMDGYGDRLKNDWLSMSVGVFGRIAARLPGPIKRSLSSILPEVPTHMKRRAISAVYMLHRTVKAMADEASDIERQSIRDTGRPLHPRDVLAHYETMRDRGRGQISYLTGPWTRR
ncbi:MAG: hypothetical protein AAFO62_13050, partial [Pseudomonadota bacterium]